MVAKGTAAPFSRSATAALDVSAHIGPVLYVDGYELPKLRIKPNIAEAVQVLHCERFEPYECCPLVQQS